MKKLFLLSCLALLPVQIPFAEAAEPHSLSVRGEGDLKIQPDVAVISLEVRAKNKDAHAAQEANARELARITKIFKNDFHLDSEEIQTTGFGVSPSYRTDRDGHQTFLGYEATHGLEVRMKALDKVGGLLDRLVGKGEGDAVSLSIQNVSFDTDQRRDYETQALGIAMQNAKARAEALAGFAKKNLRGVLRISDSNVQFTPYRGAVGAVHFLKSAVAADAAPTEIEAGQITISSSVAVEYEID